MLLPPLGMSTGLDGLPSRDHWKVETSVASTGVLEILRHEPVSVSATQMCVASGIRAKRRVATHPATRPGCRPEPPVGLFTRTVRFSCGKKRSKASKLLTQRSRAVGDRIEGHLGEVHAGAAEPFERREAVAAGDQELAAVGAQIGEGHDLGPRREHGIHDRLRRREVGLLREHGEFAGHGLYHRPRANRACHSRHWR